MCVYMDLKGWIKLAFIQDRLLINLKILFKIISKNYFLHNR